jgi:intracellular septation protein
VLFKPSVTYVIIGIVMLKAGWMNRYLPAIAGRSRPMSP